MKEKILTCVLLLMFSMAVFADKDAFVPYLMDLKNFNAEDAETMKMEVGGVKMVSGTRVYTSGSKKFTVMIMLSNQPSTQEWLAQGANEETSDGHMKAKKIDDFDAVLFFDKEAQEGTIGIILLKTEAETTLISVSYKGMSENEALALVKQFDLKKIKKKAQSL